MKIWIANSDTENEGARSRLFFSAAEANEYARDWVRDFVSTGTREDITAENWPTFYDRLQDRPGFMDQLAIEDYDLLDHPVMAEVRGVIDGLMTQIDQMSGMFSDSDGSIQAAMDDAETLLERLDPHQGKATQTEAMDQIVTDTMARAGLSHGAVHSVLVRLIFDPTQCADVTPDQYDLTPDLESICGYGADHYNLIDWHIVPETPTVHADEQPMTDAEIAAAVQTAKRFVDQWRSDHPHIASLWPRPKTE